MINLASFRNKQKTTSIFGLNVSYIDEGRDVNPIILLHSIPDWSYLWNDIIERLRDEYRVVAPDLVGHGYSDRRDCFDRSIKAQAEIFQQFIKEQGIKNPIIAGHGTGGAISMIMVINNPTYFRKLILLNSVCYDNWPIPGIIKLANPRLKEEMSPQDFVNLLKGEILQWVCDKAKCQAMLDDWMAPYSDEEGKLSMIRNAVSLNTNHTMEIVSKLQAIRIPTLLLWGAEDSFDLTYAKRLHNDIINSKLITIPRAHHFSIVDNPQDISDKMKEFVTSS